ncbi:MAG: endolytic transglycosylase MltG [Chitinispirillales bacterium]|nr:endolytic transglycosylase MltG [Chitinispirillales bacterium]
MIRFLIRYITVMLVLLLIAVAGALWSFNRYLMPMKTLGEEVHLTVERGTSPMAIANMLESHGIVRSGKIFYYWLRYADMTDKIQAGRFTFVKGEGAVSAADKLLSAETIDRTIFVKEGLTIEQTAGRIAAQVDIDSAEFVQLCLDSAFIASVGIEGAYSLEGYLFPDTYRIPENSTPAVIIRRMVARFNEVYGAVEFNPAIAARYNRHQIITLASIVEKEATLAAERGRIAGVFHNRLRLGWPLGADPTVRYIFRKFDGPLFVSELQSPSPYNTRRFAGLPPGPICSPGPGAIRATAAPDTTDYMFFVALWDGSGAHYFSRTNAEHDRMKYRVRQENELRKQRQGREVQ